VPEEQAARSVRGVVQAGTTEIEYACVGCGPPVLLLTREPAPAVCAAFVSHYRLIVPRPPPASSRNVLDAWLEVLIDGLGLEQGSLLIASNVADELAHIARSHVDRLAWVGVVPVGAGARELAALRAELDARVLSRRQASDV
jgi:hypothetical protein